MRSYLSPIDYIVDQQTARASTSYIREDIREEDKSQSSLESVEELIVRRNGIVNENNIHQIRENDTMSNLNFV